MSNDNTYDPNNQEFNRSEDDDFGLPEAEFDPIARPKSVEEQPAVEETSRPRREIEVKKEKSSNAGIWIVMVLLLLLAGAAIWYFVFNNPEPKQPIATAQPKPIETQPAEPIATFEEEPEPEVEAWVEPAPKGSLSTINSPSGSYHVIVGSFIDSDMAYDYGKKLEKEGMNASVIAPSGDRKFYRLAVSSGSYSELNTKLAEFKSKYGDNIWIVKY